MTNSVALYFSDLPDPRSCHGQRYPLIALITIAICGVVCGAEDWVSIAAFGEAKQEWFKSFLDLPHGMPSHDTFGRVFERLDPDAFERCFQQWTRGLTKVLSGSVSIDGKTLRRSIDSASKKAAIHLVSAWASEHNLVFGQLATDAKSNEITAIPKLLELLDIKGNTVTIDAAGCQKNIAKLIIDKGGDYNIALKGNQPTLEADVTKVFEDAKKEGWKDREHDTFEEWDKGHGRIERRTTTITWDAMILCKTSGFAGLRCLVQVERERIIAGQSTVTTNYYISSVNTRKASVMGGICREHWGVENKLHWCLDVGFNEDQSRARKGHSAENLSRLRRIGLNMLKRDTTKKMGIKNKRLVAGWSNDFLIQLLAGGDG
jgi:predicted transposase YbfD/YdcC